MPPPSRRARSHSIRSQGHHSFAIRRLALVAGFALALAGCGGGPGSGASGGADSTAAAAAPGRLRGVVPPEPALKPDFTLTDLEGRHYDFRRETAGRLTFLFFG